MHRCSTRRIGSWLLPLLVLAVTAFSSVSAKADTFNLSPISIDTQALSGQSGYLLFTYNPSTVGTTPVNSSVDVTSPSFGDFSLNNSGAVNYEIEPYTFGSKLTFQTSFTTTSTPGADEDTLFNLYAFDSGFNPITTTDPTGSNTALLITQYANGSISAPTVYTPFSVAPVPEASTVTLFVLVALAALITLFVRRRAQA